MRRNVAGWLTVVLILGLLAILEVKELREQGGALAHRYAGFLGYAPNLIAAATLPALWLSLGLRRGHGAYAWSQLWRDTRSQLLAVAITLAGLVGWEFAQVHRPNRTFDPSDLWATLAGAGAWLVVVFIGRALSAGSHRRLMATSGAGTTQENPSP